MHVNFVADRQVVRDASGMAEKDILQSIDILKKWLGTQPHLPEIPSDNLIECFLFINKFSIEKTKQKLDMYYTMRSLMPEISVHCNPRLPYMQNITEKMGFLLPLPKQTNEFYRVYIMKLTGPAEDFDLYKLFAHMANSMELKMQQDIARGDIYFADHRNITMNHVLKITPIHLKKMATVLEQVLSNRVKSMHVINYPPFIDFLMTLLKAVLKPKLLARIHLHNSIEEVYDYIPREILPREYGGDEPTLQELNDIWMKNLNEHSERFAELCSMKVNENLRPTKLENDDILGYHGNFKQLSVD